MPTYEKGNRFQADYDRLTPGEKAAFKVAVRKLVHDLRIGRLRKGLRVKRVESEPGVWEMTWAADGRATFEYGRSVRPGDPHIYWRRVGSHDIFENP